MPAPKSLAPAFPARTSDFGHRTFSLVTSHCSYRASIFQLGYTKDEMGASKLLVKRNDNDEMRPEYDFSHGVRGKHYEAYRAGTNVVFLDSDVAQAFGDSAAVNQALRLLLQLARTNVPESVQANKTAQPTGRTPRRAKKPKRVRAGRG